MNTTLWKELMVAPLLKAVTGFSICKTLPNLILINERQGKSVIHCIYRKMYFILHLDTGPSLSEQFATKILIRSHNI